MQILPIFKHALMITFFVFVMMLSVDFVNMASKGRVSGMPPLLSYSLKDSMLIKVFNLIFGLAAGGMLFIMGF